MHGGSTEDFGCDVPVIMTTKQGVETYESAGDTVAKNPSGTAGIKIVGEDGASEKKCKEEATEALKTLD